MNIQQLETRDTPAAVWSINGTVQIQESLQLFGITPFGADYHGPVSTAVVDTKILAVGGGLGAGPRLQLYTRDVDGFTKQYDRFVFEESFRGGINVGFADWNGDNKPDCVVGAGIGGGPRVVVIDGITFDTIADFFAYESSFRGGVYVGGYKDIAIIAPGFGGGPRIRQFQDGEQIADQFILPPDTRGILDYAYGLVSGRVELCVLATATELHTFDANLNPLQVTTLYHPFDNIGIGDYVNFGTTNLIATTGRALIGIEESIGIPLYHVDNPRDIVAGDYQYIPKTGGVLPPPPPIVPMLNQSVYQRPDLFLFAGHSIGSIPGTGTLTGLVRDNNTGELLGLTNAHVVGGLNPVVSPGRADAEPANRIPVGNVLRLDKDHNADWSVFTYLPGYDYRTHIGYYDGFADAYTELLLPPMQYDPAIVPGIGDMVYHVGRTTGFGRAVVISNSEDAAVEYPDGVVVQHDQYVLGGFGFSRPGDSGSPIFLVISGIPYIQLLLFAGDGYDRTIATPIDRVFTQAGVSYAGTGI